MSFHLQPFFTKKNSLAPTDSSRDPNNYLYDLKASRSAAQEAHKIYGGVSSSQPISPPARQTLSHRQRQSDDSLQSEHQSELWSSSVQSILDQPPASLPIQAMMAGILFSVAFGSWSYFGTIDEIGNAQGELIPEGNVFKVHSVETGQIAQLTVSEGDNIKAGQVIAELDNQLAQTEISRLNQQLSALKIEYDQKQGLLERTHLEAQTRATIAQAQIQAQQAMIAQVDTRMSGTRRLLIELQGNAQASQGRLAALQPLPEQADELLARLRADEAASRERVERLKPLVEEGAISKDLIYQAEQNLRDRERAIVQTQLSEKNSTKEQMFQAEQRLRDHQRLITQNEGELQQLKREAQRLEAELAQRQAEAESIQIEAQQRIQQFEVEMTQIQARISETQTLVSTAETRLERRFIYAPIDGMVSSLNLTNIGEVVQPGQTLAEITPKDTPLVLSASLGIKDAGFVKTGMPVKVKFDAYPYQDYGVIEGTVVSISPDTKQIDQMGSFYQVTVELEQDHIIEDGQSVQLKPGQTASADIVIRKRRIIDIILDPIRKLQAGGIEM